MAKKITPKKGKSVALKRKKKPTERGRGNSLTAILTAIFIGCFLYSFWNGYDWRN